MKKSLLKTLILTLVAGLFATSCSSKKDNDLEDMLAKTATDSDVLILSGDVEHFLDELEIKDKDGRLILPGYLQNAVNAMGSSAIRETIGLFTDNTSGIDYEDVLLTLNMDNDEMTSIFVFAVDDEKDFIGTIEKATGNAEVTEVEGFKAVGFEKSEILLKDNLGYVVITDKGLLSPTESVAVLNAKAEKAKAQPLAKWKEKYLDADCVVSVLMDYNKIKDIAAMPDASVGVPVNFDYVGVSFNLDGPAMKLTSKMFNKGGEILPTPYIGKFDMALMDYAYPTDFAALSFALSKEGYNTLRDAFSAAGKQLMIQEQDEEWFEASSYAYCRQGANVFDEVSRITSEYLTEQGAFFSFGLADNFSLATSDLQSPSSYHFVLAAHINPEKSDEAYAFITQKLTNVAETMKTLPETNGIKTTVATIKQVERFDYKHDDWVTSTFDVYVVLDDNTLVVSNGPIVRKGGAQFTKDVFKDSAVAFQVIADSNNPVVKELGLKKGVNLYGYSKAKDNELVFEITGTKENLVPALFGLATGNF